VRPNARFVKQGKDFWAHVRSVSESVGYTLRGKGAVKVPSIGEIADALRARSLGSRHVADGRGRPTDYGRILEAYFKHRADVLNTIVEPQLMDAAHARKLFKRLSSQYRPRPEDIPWNKQKGEKKAPAFLTAIVNMIVRAHCAGENCEFDPRSLTTFTRDGKPLRTLARRVDGAFPGVVNPVAVWEVKEYYYTTTFGSRVADGVYESLLDGMELEELREHEGVHVEHYLMVDAHYTWWQCGRSYLCRIIDMLHMGYVDEVLFGYEVVERLPLIVRNWVKALRARSSGRTPPDNRLVRHNVP
jgi:hypothetical protein